MTRPYPDHPFLRGNYEPLRAEIDAPDLVVEGEIPHGLEGTLYRNGPNPLFPPRDAYHYFTGDGMVHAFTFREGRVSYRNRWVRTEKWRADAEAGEALFGAFGNPFSSDPSVRGVRYNVANTHIVAHGGKLLALEEGSPPFELEAETLRSIGSHTWEGKLPSTMTAHPKLDPVTGELHFFGYGLDGPGSTGVGYYVADAPRPPFLGPSPTGRRHSRSRSLHRNGGPRPGSRCRSPPRRRAPWTRGAGSWSRRAAPRQSAGSCR